MNEADYYVVLGVARTASTDEIDEAYRKTITTYSLGAVPGPVAVKMSDRALKAWETLRDPALRADYDARTNMGAAGYQPYDPYSYDPYMASDEKPDFTTEEYLLRLKVPLAVLGSVLAVIALHILSGAYMNPERYASFCVRSLAICAVVWAGYLVVRVSVVSKAWLPIYAILSGFTHSMMTYRFLTELYQKPSYHVRRNSDARPAMIVFYMLLFFLCFEAAAIYLEKGKFTDNIRRINKLFIGRFNKPGW